MELNLPLSTLPFLFNLVRPLQEWPTVDNEVITHLHRILAGNVGLVDWWVSDYTPIRVASHLSCTYDGNRLISNSELAATDAAVDIASPTKQRGRLFQAPAATIDLSEEGSVPPSNIDNSLAPGQDDAGNNPFLSSSFGHIANQQPAVQQLSGGQLSNHQPAVQQILSPSIPGHESTSHQPNAVHRHFFPPPGANASSFGPQQFGSMLPVPGGANQVAGGPPGNLFHADAAQPKLGVGHPLLPPLPSVPSHQPVSASPFQPQHVPSPFQHTVGRATDGTGQHQSQYFSGMLNSQHMQAPNPMVQYHPRRPSVSWADPTLWFKPESYPEHYSSVLTFFVYADQDATRLRLFRQDSSPIDPALVLFTTPPGEKFCTLMDQCLTSPTTANGFLSSYFRFLAMTKTITGFDSTLPDTVTRRIDGTLLMTFLDINSWDVDGDAPSTKRLGFCIYMLAPLFDSTATDGCLPSNGYSFRTASAMLRLLRLMVSGCSPSTMPSSLFGSALQFFADILLLSDVDNLWDGYPQQFSCHFVRAIHGLLRIFKNYHANVHHNLTGHAGIYPAYQEVGVGSYRQCLVLTAGTISHSNTPTTLLSALAIWKVNLENVFQEKVLVRDAHFWSMPVPMGFFGSGSFDTSSRAKRHKKNGDEMSPRPSSGKDAKAGLEKSIDKKNKLFTATTPLLGRHDPASGSVMAILNKKVKATESMRWPMVKDQHGKESFVCFRCQCPAPDNTCSLDICGSIRSRAKRPNQSKDVNPLLHIDLAKPQDRSQPFETFWKPILDFIRMAAPEVTPSNDLKRAFPNYVWT
jgi:hypothetical protein